MRTFNNIISAYELFAEGNEASPTFHTWGALSLLSSLVSRRVWFDQKYYKIYPNLYVVFVGEPGDKKTTAMNIARQFAQKSDVKIAPPSITKEAVTMMLGSKNKESPFLTQLSTLNEFGPVLVEAAHMSFFASEIVTMLSAGGNPIGMIEFLTDIYDRETFEVVTKNKGTDVIICPYLTMLACMTPEQTGSMLKQNLITGGFSRRCVFVFGRSKLIGVPFPELTDTQKAAAAFIEEHLTKIKETIKGEFTFTADARAFFEHWYQRKHQLLQQEGNAVHKNWLRSKDVIAIKVSMLLRIGALDTTRTIDLPTLQRAIAMLDKVEPDLDRIFSGAGRNVSNELATKILTHLREARGQQLPRKKLLQFLFSDGTAQEITEAFNFLFETQQVVRKAHPTQSAVEIIHLASASPESTASSDA
jgi:hypothetical protein